MAKIETLKRDSELVQELETEAQEFKKTLAEIEKMPPSEKNKMERDFQETWMAAYNFRIRKMQRDANVYLGTKSSAEMEENKNRLDSLIMNVPLGAYISYLEKQCKNIQTMYDQLKAEMDKLEGEKKSLLEQARNAKDLAEREELMTKARGKIGEIMNKGWIMENVIGMDLFSDVSEDLGFIEKIVSKLPPTATAEERAYGEALGKMQKSMTELKGKIPKGRISSEDRTIYFSEK